jgi:DNA-binding response OmpR family regulator
MNQVLSASEAPNTTRLLIVEDETHLAQGLLFNLQVEGYSVSLEADGESALQRLAQEEPFDAIILDVMLPGKNGFEVVSELRQKQNYVPVLILTARGRPEDILQGFAAGADDYLPKPFDLSILLARLHSLLRRTAWQRPQPDSAPEKSEPSVFSFAGRKIDFSSLELEAFGKTTRLTVMEADLLRYLVRNQGRIVSRKELLEQVWRVHEDTDTRAIDNFIVRLRRYMEEEPTRPVYLTTIRGVGYRFQPTAEPAKE